MSAHTPTPWQLKSDYEPTVIIAGVDGEYFDGRLYATYTIVCEVSDGYDDAASKANAAHIVKCVNAMPEIIDSLETAKSWFETIQDDLSSPQTREALRPEQLTMAISQIEAILAKVQS